MDRTHRRLFFPLPLLLSILLLGACGAAVGAAEPIPRDVYAFLGELAALREVSGFPPALFRPEERLSRFEIAFFLFRFDRGLADLATPRGLDLEAALALIWSAAHPNAPREEALAWAEKAGLRYRYLLIEYHREMSALGYRLRPNAYPEWSRSGHDVLGD